MSNDAQPTAMRFALIPELASHTNGGKSWPVFRSGDVTASVTELPGSKLCFVVIGLPNSRTAVLLCQPVAVARLASGEIGVAVEVGWTMSHITIALNGLSVCQQLLAAA